MWYKTNFFKYAAGLLIIFLNIYFLGKIDFFLIPFRNFIATIFFPLLISGLLYYLLRPLVNYLIKIKIGKFNMPRALAILIIFILLLLILAGFSATAGSLVVTQVKQLYNDLPLYFQIASDKTVEFFKSGGLSFIPIDQLQQQLTVFLGKAVPFLTQGVISGITAVAGIATVLIIVPFILFYLLKDDKIFYNKIISLIPVKRKQSCEEILEDVDKTLSAYIIGQALVAFTIGILMYIGFLILGLDYALILALFAMLTAFIPILGAFIGIVPAVVVGLTVDPIMAVKVLILMIIVQQLEGNLISPQIMGKRMNIHPLTFIILLLAAASLFGFIGMLIAVPLYAVIKVIGKGFYKIYKLEKN